MTTDPIADLLTRIRNGSASNHDKVDIPHSHVKEGIVEVLKRNGLIKNFRVVKDNKQGMMRIYLKPKFFEILQFFSLGRRELL